MSVSPARADDDAPRAPAPRLLAVIERADIEASGLTLLGDLLLDRSDYNAFALHRPMVLGPGAVAFLVDGRPMSGSLDSLPLSAVERIEVLDTGAAVRHDSAAIARAINIVLRRNQQGFEVTAGGQLPEADGGETAQGGALWGGQVGEGHLVVGVDTSHRSEIRHADRDFSRASWAEGGSFAGTSGVSIGGNTAFFKQGDVTVASALGDCAPGLGYTGVLSSPGGYTGTGCGFAYADISWETIRTDHRSLFSSFDHPVGDSAQVYFDARLAQTDLALRYAPSVGQFTILDPPAELLAAAGADSGPLIVYHRFLAHGNRDWKEEQEARDFTLGLRGDLPASIGFDLSVRTHRSEESESGATFVSEALAIAAIEAGDYDIVNPLSTDPAHLEAVDAMAVTFARDASVDRMGLDAALDGTALALPGGEMLWSAGVGLDRVEAHDRTEHRDASGELHALEDVLGSGGVSWAGERTTRSGFAELWLPPLSGWTVSLGARLDDRDDVGTSDSLEVASAWQPSEVLELRGSWRSGSRPPSFSSLHATATVGYPYVCDTGTHTGLPADCDRVQIKTLQRGNPALEPDRADALSLGGKVDLDRLSLAADWFRIEVSDAPALTATQTIVDMDAAGETLPRGAAVVRDQNRVITEIHNPLVNTGEETISGLDLRARAGWTAGWAETGIDIRWLRVTDHEIKVDGVAQPGDFPRHRVHATLRASRGRLMAAWHVLARSGFENVYETGRFGSWVGHDLALDRRDAFGVNGLTLGGGVLNLTDRGPSIDSSDPGSVSGGYNSVRGRTLFLRAAMSW